MTTSYTITEPVVLDDLDAANWVASGVGAAAANVTDVLRPGGTRSLRATGTKANWISLTRTWAGDQDWSAHHRFSLWLELDQWDKAYHTIPIAFRQSNTANKATYTIDPQFLFGGALACRRPGWYHLDLKRSDFTYAGTFTENVGWNLVRSALIQFDVDDPDPVIYLDHLTGGGYSRPNISITFDDGLPSVRSVAYPILRARGLPFSCFVNSSTVGTAGFLTLAECHEMHDDPICQVDICNHTATHTPWQNTAALSYATCLSEIETGRDWLIANGFTRRNEHLYFCPPGGVLYDSTDATSKATDLNRVTAIAASGSRRPWIGTTIGTQYPTHNSHEADDGFMFRQRSVISKTTTIPQIEAAIQKAIQHGGHTALQLHGVSVDAAGANDILTSTMQWIADRLDALRGQVDTVSITQYEAGKTDATAAPASATNIRRRIRP